MMNISNSIFVIDFQYQIFSEKITFNKENFESHFLILNTIKI
jgi:hypothetical protein